MKHYPLKNPFVSFSSIKKSSFFSDLYFIYCKKKRNWKDSILCIYKSKCLISLLINVVSVVLFLLNKYSWKSMLLFNKKYLDILMKTNSNKVE